MSSFLPNLVVADTFKKLNLSGMAAATRQICRPRSTAGLDRLNDSLKHDDGGWGWWPEDQSRVFMTAYVVSGLAQAKAAGYAKGRCQNLGRWESPTCTRQQLASTSPHVARTARLRGLLAQPGRRAVTWRPSSSKPYGRAAATCRQKGLALTGLAMQRAQDDGRAAQIAQLLETKAQHAKASLSPGPPISIRCSKYPDDNNAESTAFALRFLIQADPLKAPLLEAAAQWLVAEPQ